MISAAATDSDLATHIDGLTRFAADTHTRLLLAVGPASDRTSPVEHLLNRSNAGALLDISHYVDIFNKTLI